MTQFFILHDETQEALQEAIERAVNSGWFCLEGIKDEGEIVSFLANGEKFFSETGYYQILTRELPRKNK